jgi:hypothetical protein
MAGRVSETERAAQCASAVESAVTADRMLIFCLILKSNCAYLKTRIAKALLASPAFPTKFMGTFYFFP